MMGGRGGWGRQTGPIRQAHDTRRTLRRMVQRLRPELPKLILAIVLGATAVGLAVAGPRLLGDATNILFDGVISKTIPPGVTQAQVVAHLRATGQGNLASLVQSLSLTPGRGVDWAAMSRTVLAAVGVYLAAAVFTWGQAFLMAGVAQRTVYRMRRDVDSKLTRLPLRYFDSKPHGEVLSRVTNDIDNITTTLQQGLSQLLTSVLTIVGVLGMMFWISWLLALVSVITIPMALWGASRVAKRSQVHFGNQWRRTGVLNSHVEGMHTGHALVQLFGRTDEAIERFDAYNEALYEPSFRAQFLSGVIQPAMTLLSNVNYVVVAAVGGWSITTGRLSLGDVTAFIQYSRQFTMPMTQIASQMNMLQSGLASAERVFEFLDQPEEPVLTDVPAQLPPRRGRVVLDHVSFRYVPDTPLIEDFTLTVEPGETVAIVGPTGAGKTTLVNLLMRFYEVDAGRILLDGVDYRDLSRETVRSAYGMVLQDTWLFAGSIHDNIAYGRETASDEQVQGAAQAALADHFIHTLPDGYATVLTTDATNISAGQKQLLTIARAFLAEPTILILDEATSSVDSRTEVLIQEAMAQLRQGRTSFVIAHRLSTIRNADTILVMEHGRVVEQGSHEVLMAADGAYARLYQSQFEGVET